MKEEIKKRLIEFQKDNPTFNDRSPDDVAKAEKIYKELLYDFSQSVIIEAIEEMREEITKEVLKARDKFYRNIADYGGKTK